MSTNTEGPQTFSIVIIQLLGSIALFEVVWVVTKYLLSSSLTWNWGIATGTVLTSFNVARQYHKSAPDERLAAVSAIVFGLLCIGLIVGAMALAGFAPRHDPTFIAITAGSLFALSTPSLYLVGAGVRRFRNVRPRSTAASAPDCSAGCRED